MPSIERDGRRVSFEERGSGIPLLLGHGFLFDRGMWAAQEDALAGRARVVLVDFPGHGRSGPVAGALTLEDLTGDLVAVLDHLGLESAVWGGLSLGGMVALRAALRHPERVRGLALLDTDAGRETFLRRVKYRLMMLGVRLCGLRPFLPLILPIYFGRTTRESRPEIVARWRERFLAADVRSALRVFAAILRRRSLLDRLDGIRAPAVVIVGEEDTALPPVRSERIAAALPRAGLVTVPEAGHISCVEAPEAVNRALADFLDSLG